MKKLWQFATKVGIVTVACLLVLVAASFLQGVAPNNRVKNILTIGLAGVAYASTPDYTVTGTGDVGIVQSAIGSLPSTGGKLILFAGTYYFADSANITTPVSIDGSGSGMTIITNTVDGKDCFAVSNTNAKWVEFSNLQFTTNVTSPTGGSGVKVTNDVQNLRFTNIFFNGTYDGLNFVSASGWIVSRCFFYARHDGIINTNPAFSGDEGDNHISDSDFTAYGSDTSNATGLYWTAGGGIYISNCKFQYFKNSIDFTVATTVNTAVLELAAVSIENFGTTGLNIDATAGSSSFGKISLNGAEFYTSANATIINTAGQVYWLSLTGGTLAFDDTNGTCVALGGGSLVTFTGVNFQGGQYGINNTGASSVMAVGNTFNTTTTPFNGTISHYHNVGGGD